MAADVPTLLAGPYRPPACRRGDWLNDAARGRVQVGGWTAAPIPWPRRRKTGRAALILTPELARAVRVESVAAICHWWGVGATTVWAWRQTLGVARVTEGTRARLRERAARRRKPAGWGVRANAWMRGKELPVLHRGKWTAPELNYLASNHRKRMIQAIALALGRTPAAVRSRARRLE